MFQKSMLKEYAVVAKGNRDTVRQRDHGLQRALNGDREALGHIFAPQTPRLYRAALRIQRKYIKGKSGFKCWNETCGSCLRATSQFCG